MFPSFLFPKGPQPAAMPMLCSRLVQAVSDHVGDFYNPNMPEEEAEVSSREEGVTGEWVVFLGCFSLVFLGWTLNDFDILYPQGLFWFSFLAAQNLKRKTHSFGGPDGNRLVSMSFRVTVDWFVIFGRVCVCVLKCVCLITSILLFDASRLDGAWRYYINGVLSRVE